MNRQFPKAVLISTLFWLVLFPLALPAQNNPFNNTGIPTALVRSRVLAADEAFAFSAFIEAPDKVILLWEIEEDYYLYQQSISVTTSEKMVIDPELFPLATNITDEYFGESKVYFDRLLMRLPLKAFNTQNGRMLFTVEYQGCAKDRYCYPMLMKTIDLQLPE